MRCLVFGYWLLVTGYWLLVGREIRHYLKDGLLQWGGWGPFAAPPLGDAGPGDVQELGNRFVRGIPVAKALDANPLLIKLDLELWWGHL
jgi:hypothetical protein